MLPLTLDTLRAQKGSFEVLLLDGEGSGRLADLGKRYPELALRVEDASGRTLAEIMNRGAELSRGKYLQFIEPGDRYLSQHGLAFLSEFIQQHGEPDLIYTHSLFQGVISPVDLKTAHSPWFLRSKLLHLGGFDRHLELRPTLDFLCRLLQKPETQTLFCPRVLLDPVSARTGAKDAMSYARETCKILYRHYGFWHTMKWMFVQDPKEALRRSAAFLKQAFWQAD